MVTATQDFSIIEQINNFPLLLKIIIVIFLATLVFMIYVKQKYSVVIDWWRTNNGDKYTFFNIYIFLMAFESNLFYMFYSQLFQSHISLITNDHMAFIINFCVSKMKVKEQGKYKGICLPRNVCESIKMTADDDSRFASWVIANNKDEKQIATYDKDGKQSDEGNKGIYPHPTDFDGWAAKFSEWTSPRGSSAKQWGPQNKSAGSLKKFPYNDDMKPDDKKTIFSNWNDIDAHPDNMFARYQIPVDCPLIIGFANGAYNDPRTGLLFDTSACTVLLGGITQYTPGGWLGYAISCGRNVSYNQLINQISATYLTETYPTPDDAKKSSCNKGAAITSSFAGAVGMAMMAAFLIPSTGGAGALLLGGVLAGVGGISGASSCLFPD